MPCWGQHRHFLSLLRSSCPIPARSLQQAELPSLLPGKLLPLAPGGAGGPSAGCVCRSACFLSRVSRKAAVIYEPWTVLAECSGGLDYSFPEEAVCLEMAR